MYIFSMYVHMFILDNHVLLPVPPEDEGWLCPVCDCKLECLDAVNAYFGTSYGMEDHWKVMSTMKWHCIVFCVFFFFANALLK